MFAVNAPITTLGPDAALQRYIEHRQEQSSRLPSYESETSVHAELPDSAQHGDYELIANYRADPRALNYVSVHFEGDRFVKSNIILRILQSEADHVRKKDDGSTAINEQNYKFSYAGIEQVHNRQAHVFHLKPRRKKPGLFKGQISLDASTGSMLRMEGTLVKSPSMFVRDINFVQDFEEFEGFTLPTELHSWARARFIGRTMVNIVHRSYKLQRDSERAHRQLPEREISDRGSGTN
ncbi:MAG: hypothetical protein CXZ00_05335 [Acidobacteria bacterium]|nr:MAG: hypothetical protein CXZ00_05335 [Acidobacteriota bacterium]